MSSRPWMPLYWSDFRADTLDLRTDEIGCYLLLLMLAWRRDDGALPDDKDWLKRSLQACAADFHGHTFNRIVPKLLARYFALGPDRKWRNKRLTLEREKAAKRSANGQQMAHKRWHGSNLFNGLPHAKAMQITITKESSIISDSEIGPKTNGHDLPLGSLATALPPGALARQASSELEAIAKRKGWAK